MISRRRLRPWIALLLPLMLLRALLPPGYMPVAADGELQIVMCSAGLPGGASTDSSGTDHAKPAENAGCLYAHAAAFAPPGAAACCAVNAAALSFDVPQAAQRPPAAGPLRFATARGPPQLLKA